MLCHNTEPQYRATEYYRSEPGRTGALSKHLSRTRRRNIPPWTQSAAIPKLQRHPSNNDPNMPIDGISSPKLLQSKLSMTRVVVGSLGVGSKVALPIADGPKVVEWEVGTGTGPVTVEPPIGLCVADESLPICLNTHRYPPGIPPSRTEHHPYAYEKERTKKKEQKTPTAKDCRHVTVVWLLLLHS